MNFLTSSVVKAEESEDFAEIQRAQVRRFREHHPDGAGGPRLAGARRRADRQRLERPAGEVRAVRRGAAGPHRHATGSARLLFAPDLVGTSEQIAERLYAHAGFREVDEVAFALPFSFEHDDYVQILTDIATQARPRARLATDAMRQ